MLPGSGIRRRGGAVSMADGMHRLQSVMNDSARRYRRLPLAGKVIFCLSLVFSFFLYTIIFHRFMRHNVTDDKFLEIDYCPACFGSSGCGLIYSNQLQLSGWSNYRLHDIFNSKNIKYGSLLGSKKVVLKKFGTDREILELDHKICKDANRPEGCDVGRVFFISNLAVSLRKDPLQPKHLTETVGMFTCASYRLLDRLWTKYRERRKPNALYLGDKLQVWYAAALNPEPLLLQAFPASERWPFPEYFGACGRHVIEEHVGQTLDNFASAPFPKRAGIAYELLKIAEQFTHNEDDYALYITDPGWDNFGVDSSGKVRVLDAENIIVVDKLAVEAKKPRGYDTFIQSEHGDCEDSACLTMVPANLCTHLHSDHNYYAICTNLLDPLLDDKAMPGGLLHDMPVEARDFWDLENLVKECARPTKHKGRIFAKDKLLTALFRLHDQSDDHLKSPSKVDPRGLPPDKQLKKELWEYQDYDTLERDKVKGDKPKEGEESAKDIGFDEEGERGAVIIS